MQNSVKRLICKKKTLIPLQHRVSVPEKVQSLSLCNVGRENLKPCLKSQAVQMARNVFHPSLFHPWNSFHLNRRKRDNPRRELFLYLIHENKSLGIICLFVKCGQICSAALFCCKTIWWSHCIAEYQRIFPQNFCKSSSSSILKGNEKVLQPLQVKCPRTHSRENLGCEKNQKKLIQII